MKGKVLDFSLDQSEGLISGDDGKRYTFRGKEWKAKTIPATGDRVDFDSEGKLAIGVYLDAPAKVKAKLAIGSFLLSITRLKPPASSRSASAVRMRKLEE